MKSKNEFSTHTLSTLSTLATNTLKRANNAPKGGNTRTADKESTFTQQGQDAAAKQVSSILSGLYKQHSASEWEWLRVNQPEWMQKRNRLENELDGHFLAGNLEAVQEPFYQLIEHLKAAPIDELSSRIARQLDKL